jgi:uncharacterized membrane protein
LERDEPFRPASGWRGFGTLCAGAIAIAATAAIGIVATAITVVVLPVALVIAWRLRTRSRVN